MSRIGKLPVTVPSGVEVTIDGRLISVKGPKGTLSHTIVEPIRVERVGTVNLKALSDAAKRGVERPLDTPNPEFGNWAGEAEKPSVPNGLGVSPPSPHATWRSQREGSGPPPDHRDKRRCKLVRPGNPPSRRCSARLYCR